MLHGLVMHTVLSGQVVHFNTDIKWTPAGNCRQLPQQCTLNCCDVINKKWPLRSYREDEKGRGGSTERGGGEREEGQLVLTINVIAWDVISVKKNLFPCNLLRRWEGLGIRIYCGCAHCVFRSHLCSLPLLFNGGCNLFFHLCPLFFLFLLMGVLHVHMWPKINKPTPHQQLCANHLGWVLLDTSEMNAGNGQGPKGVAFSLSHSHFKFLVACCMQKWRGRSGIFYHPSDVNVHCNRGGEGPNCKNVFHPCPTSWTRSSIFVAYSMTLHKASVLGTATPVTHCACHSLSEASIHWNMITKYNHCLQSWCWRWALAVGLTSL